MKAQYEFQVGEIVKIIKPITNRSSFFMSAFPVGLITEVEKTYYERGTYFVVIKGIRNEEKPYRYNGRPMKFSMALKKKRQRIRPVTERETFHYLLNDSGPTVVKNEYFS